MSRRVVAASPAARWRRTYEGRTTPKRFLGRSVELSMELAVHQLGDEAHKLLHMNVGDDFQDNYGDHWERIA